MKIYHTLLLAVLLLCSGCKNKSQAITDIDFKRIHNSIWSEAAVGTTIVDESQDIGTDNSSYSIVFKCPSESDAMKLIFITRENVTQMLRTLNADIHGGSGVTASNKRALSFSIQYRRGHISGFMRMKFYYNERKEVLAEFIFYESA